MSQCGHTGEGQVAMQEASRQTSCRGRHQVAMHRPMGQVARQGTVAHYSSVPLPPQMLTPHHMPTIWLRNVETFTFIVETLSLNVETFTFNVETNLHSSSYTDNLGAECRNF